MSMSISKKKKNINIVKGLLGGFTSGTIPLHLFFLVYAVLCLVPLFLVASISISDENTIAQYGYQLIPEKVSFTAYKYVLKEADSILRSYGVTVFITVVGTICGLLVVGLYAYPISRKDFRYRKFFSFFAFFTMLFSAGIVPWYFVVVRVMHLKDNLLVLFLPYLQNAWYMMIMRTFYKTIPDSLVESAKIDGASEYRVFFQIILPLSVPGLATIGLFFTILLWNDFWLNLFFIENPALYHLQYLMMRVQNNIQYLSSMASSLGGASAEILKMIPSRTAQMAMCILSIGPIVLAYPFFQRYFVKGLTIGAIKE